jgi:hypothetical protein
MGSRVATYSYAYVYTAVTGGQRALRTSADGGRAGTPVGGGQADTPAGAIALPGIYACALGGDTEGAPAWMQGRCINMWPVTHSHVKSIEKGASPALLALYEYSPIFFLFFGG